MLLNLLSFVAMMKYFFIFCLSVSCVFTSFSQQKVLLFGKVLDTLQSQNFYNLMIINRTTGQGVFGQPDGNFSVYVNENDSINLSVKGYPIIGFRVVADSNRQMKITAVLESKVQVQKEVVVKPLKTLQQIKEERASLSMRETRMVTGIEVMRSPITALYQRFSEKEQNKRWIAEQQYKDNQSKIVRELLRLYVAYDIVDLSEEEFEDFITFLNINEDFLKTSSDMELITFIKDKFEHYKNLKR